MGTLKHLLVIARINGTLGMDAQLVLRNHGRAQEMVLVMDLFCVLLSWNEMAPAPDVLVPGSLHRLLVNTEKAYLSRNYPSGVAAVLWFICSSASPTVTSARAVNQDSLKAELISATVWRSLGAGEQYTVTVSSQYNISNYFGTTFTFECLFQVLPLEQQQQKVRIPWKRTLYF